MFITIDSICCLYYYQLFRNSMRSRSGAFHADTEESFLELATASQSTTGVFYDREVNCKVLKTLKPKKRASLASQNKLLKAPSCESQGDNHLFSGFDFSVEVQGDKQEREQLERMKTQRLRQINVGILTNRPTQLLQDLSQLLGVPVEQQELSRGVNLVVATRKQTICKYWIFQKDLVSDKDELLSLYLGHCSELYDVDETSHDFSVLRSGSACDESWIKQNITTILI